MGVAYPAQRKSLCRQRILVVKLPGRALLKTGEDFDAGRGLIKVAILQLIWLKFLSVRPSVPRMAS